MSTLIHKEGGRRRRKNHGVEFRAKVIELCYQPGISVSSVARQYDLNVNVVYRWLSRIALWSQRRINDNKSPMAETALRFIQELYEIEREVQGLSPEERWNIRQCRGKPIAQKMHEWLINTRIQTSDGSARAKAMDYSLKRWGALVRYLDNAQLPIDNNKIENEIRPIAIGRKNWLFAGSHRAGKRAVAAMSLIKSAKLNGHDPYIYLKDVL